MSKQIFYIGRLLAARSICAAALFALCSMVVDPRFSAQAQSTHIPRIGYFRIGNPKTPGPQVEGFRQGLRDLNYVEGKNILVEYRYVEQGLDRVPGLVAELVRLKVNVLVATFTVATRRSHAGDQDDSHRYSRPVLIRLSLDLSTAWRAQAVISRDSPDFTREFSGKRLELLKKTRSADYRASQSFGTGSRASEPAMAS